MKENTRGQQVRQSLPGDVRGPVFYDAQLYEFWVNGTLVKRIDIRAVNQIAILTAFQEENWGARIDDPLHPNNRDEKARMRDAIYSLNQSHRARLVHFFADGSGEGIRWEFISRVADIEPKRNQRNI